MPTKLIKFFTGNWKLLAGIVTVAITIFGGIQSCRATRWEAEAQRLDGKLEEQTADQDKLYGEAAKARAARNVAETEEKAKREALEARIKEVVREGEKMQRALVAEWRKTTTLPPDALAEQINERIGEESRPTAAGLFLFTRVGTERTLNRFKEGEFHLSEYGKYQKVLVDHGLEVASFNTSIKQCEKTAATNLTGWDDCRGTLATAMADITALKKTKQGGVWKGRLQGGAIAITFVALLKLLGTW